MTTPVAGVRDGLDGRAQERRPLGPETYMWKDAGLITYVLTSGSAFLLQTMEPAFAAVSEAHSTFRSDPIGRAVRSVASVMMWVYGDEASLAEADRLREVHAGLAATNDGVRYTALSSGPWAWVMHANIYSYFVRNAYFGRRKLTMEDKETVYQEAVQIMRNLVVAPKQIPSSYREWETFFAETVETHLKSTTAASEYLAVIGTLPPPERLPRRMRPVWRMAAAAMRPVLLFCTIGTLPEAARRTLGVQWSARDERRLRVLGWLIGHGVEWLPERWRYLPIAREARRAERARGQLRVAIASRPV